MGVPFYLTQREPEKVGICPATQFLSSNKCTFLMDTNF